MWVFLDGMIADIGRGFRVRQQTRMVWASEGRDSFYMVHRLWREPNGDRCKRSYGCGQKGIAISV